MLPLIYHSQYSALTLPEKHRYPINKYRLLYEAIFHSELQPNVSIHQPSKASIETIKSLHDTDYVDALLYNRLPAAKMRRIGFPWSEALITRTLFSTGGTQLTVDLALEHGIAIHLSGGYHHAHYDFGSGFCLFNDLAIAAKHALSYPHIDKVMIIDCDVHHGDGTATLLANEPDVITFSVHCDKNFPARKPNSDFDLALERETSTSDYLAALQGVLPLALALHQPDLVIYDAGVDIHQHDELGYFNVSKDGLYHRDHYILSQCQTQNIPVAAVIGGGYRKNHQDLVELHLQLIHAALAVHHE
ncbi:MULTISPECIES: histone deacetylase [unclassified Photobacterium]|uniref:histone deacetylase family protein n=1 Tax=unclassified Photobacterium TaxID=2628852 RepID=UPI001EDEC7B7|nr:MULTISPECIES: histone deacetylase [unclassified Photobacterium]MCG3862564.1 histone deacetylase [Photobacterium sp. Ph6]MCG3873937.1 histone deacetylase [Photobacterium sp. Ph5]